MTRLSGATLAALFMASLAVPLLAVGRGQREPAPPGAASERVVPPPRLPLDLRQALSLPGQLRDYLQTRFGFRGRLITWHSYLTLRYLHASPSRDVVLGRRGWLFDNRGNVLEDHLGLRPYDVAELAQWRRELETRQRWLEKRGIRYLVVLVPSSYAIYPEYLPANAQRTVGPARIDQLLAYMRGSEVRMLDLRPALLRAKRYGILYYRTDAHWNQLGAYFGYVEIARCLEDWYPNLRPAPLRDFRVTRTAATGGFLARLIGLEGVIGDMDTKLVPRRRPSARTVTVTRYPFRGGNIEVMPKVVWITQRPRSKGPRLVAFRDSYADAFIPFLSEHFGRAYYAWTWTLSFNPALVESERPQVVIEEQVSSALLLGAGRTTPAFAPLRPARRR